MSNINRYVPNYCVIDIETTGLYADSEIIEISALKVRNGVAVEEYSTLIDPLCHIPEKSSKIHHITDDMVAGCPTFEDILPAFLSFIADDVLCGYNIASFDYPKISKKVEQITGEPLTNDYLDVLQAVRRKEKQLERKSLENVSKYYGLDTEGEHRALKDCYLTHSVLAELYTRYGDNAFKGFVPPSKHSTRPQTHFAQDTLLLQELQAMIEGIIFDGMVSPLEAYTLEEWMEEHRQLSGHFPFDRAFAILKAVLKDNIVTEEEATELALVLSDAADPIHEQQNRVVETLSSVKDKHICLTGEFSYGTKNDVESLIEKAGGIIDSSTHKTTDYIAIGDEGSSDWITGNYGTKIKKALEYNEKYGTQIRFIEEGDLIAALNYILKRQNTDDSDEDEIITVYDTSGWIAAVENLLISLEEEEELPKSALYLAKNIGKDNEIISRSICICEPEFSHSGVVEDPGKGRNAVVINIKESDDSGYDFALTPSQYYSIPLSDADVTERITGNTSTCYVHARLSLDDLISFLRANVYYSLANYKSKAASFGCCSLFGKCCDARKCLHTNKLYATACACFQNMRQGRYVSGEYRNIDVNLNVISVVVPEEKLDRRHQFLMQRAYRESIKGAMQADAIPARGSKASPEPDTKQKNKKRVFVPLSVNDTKELRGKLDLPKTKSLVYKRVVDGILQTYEVTDYSIERYYEPIGELQPATLLVTVDGIGTVRIHSDYLVEMQKADFTSY